MTICVKNREPVLATVAGGETYLTDIGMTVVRVWDELPDHYPTVSLDAFVAMPDHVHGIILIEDPVGGRAGLRPAPTVPDAVGAGLRPARPAPQRPALSEIVRAFKSFSARRVNELRGTSGAPFWQRNYYEHVIRDDRELNIARAYIMNNPLSWSLDHTDTEAPHWN